MHADWTTFHSNQQPLKVTVQQRRGMRSEKYHLPLPLFIGNSSLCDIVINSTSLAPVAKVLYSPANQGLVLYDLVAKQSENLDQLKAFGLSLQLISNTDGTEKIRNLARRISQLEYALVEKLPLLKKLPQVCRFSLYVIAMSWMLLALAAAQVPTKVLTNDASQRAIPLQYAEVFSYSIDSIAADRSYAKGVLFHIKKPEELSREGTRLSFVISDLNEVDEFELSFNEHKITTLSHDAACIVEYCNLSFLIPSDWWQKANNSLFFSHKVPASNFVLQNVLLQAVSASKADDKVRVEERLAGIERLYEERFITPKNLVSAASELRKVLAFIDSFNDLADKGSRARVLLDKVEIDLKQVQQQLWFEADRTTALGQNNEALKHLGVLKELYPPREEAMHRRIEKQIKTLQKREL